MSELPANYSLRLELAAMSAAAASIHDALIRSGCDAADPEQLLEILAQTPPQVPAASPIPADLEAPAPENVTTWIAIIEALLPLLEKFRSIFKR